MSCSCGHCRTDCPRRRRTWSSAQSSINVPVMPIRVSGCSRARSRACRKTQNCGCSAGDIGSNRRIAPARSRIFKPRKSCVRTTPLHSLQPASPKSVSVTERGRRQALRARCKSTRISRNCVNSCSSDGQIRVSNVAVAFPTSSLTSSRNTTTKRYTPGSRWTFIV